jgi:hypothetical protein
MKERNCDLPVQKLLHFDCSVTRILCGWLKNLGSIYSWARDIVPSEVSKPDLGSTQPPVLCITGGSFPRQPRHDTDHALASSAMVMNISTRVLNLFSTILLCIISYEWLILSFTSIWSQRGTVISIECLNFIIWIVRVENEMIQQADSQKQGHNF